MPQSHNTLLRNGALVIILRNKPRNRIRYGSSQIWYASIYVAITLVVLLILNIYCAKISHQMFYTEKEASMTEKCKFAASVVTNLEAINANTIANAISGVDDLNVSRLIITDMLGQAIYDSLETSDNYYVLYPEVIKALQGNNVFYWTFHDGIMRSTAAAPIYIYGALTGCVYIMEYDYAQGAFLSAHQNNILIITLILELIVILFSIVFSKLYSKRFKRILSSIRTLRKGDYNQKISISGYDELNDLGNEFNELSRRLRISEEKRNRFVSDASHELKTPLASIKLLSESILQNDMDMDTVREFVTDIGNEAERLNKMSQKLLTLSGDESKIEQDYSIVYIEPTIDRVVRMLQSAADINNVQINKYILNDCPVLFLEDDLYEIIYNLTENGIKYNKTGGSVTISVEKKENNCIIQFRDTGVGIPKESIEHIFERFYRVDKARSRSTGGSGLGLSIVRNITERNNGIIYVESTLGEGSIFTLQFPIFDTEEVE